jgi:predicted PurR-regulated permease PerM
MLAAIGGFSVAGVVGSLLAVPTIGATKAVFSYIRHRDDPDFKVPIPSEHRFELRSILRRLRPHPAT